MKRIVIVVGLLVTAGAVAAQTPAPAQPAGRRR